MTRSGPMVAAIALLLCGMGQLKAVPITFSESGIASGFLGAAFPSGLFVNSLVTVVLAGDTDNLTSGGNPSLTLGIATVTVQGIGTATFSDPMVEYSSPMLNAYGLGDASNGVEVLGITSAALSGYGLNSAIGPIVSSSPDFYPGFSFLTTDGRHFGLDTIGSVTFTATMGTAPVPEPSMPLLIGAGLLGFMGIVRRKLA